MRMQGKARIVAAIVSIGALSAVGLSIYWLRSWEGDRSSPATSTSARNVAPENESRTECGQVSRIDENITPQLATARAADSELGYSQYKPRDKSRPSSIDDVRCDTRSDAADRN